MPIEVSASNWTATAMVVAAEHPDVILLDMGSTTTDIIPIESGQVRALGRTDPDRLATGELVYSGALRTPVEALVRAVPWRGGMALVSADGFAHTGDVHQWLGTVIRPARHEPGTARDSRNHAGERLARVVCADRTMIDDDGITTIATHVAEAQVAAIATRRGAGTGASPTPDACCRARSRPPDRRAGRSCRRPGNHPHGRPVERRRQLCGARGSRGSIARGPG